jgi:hypothetical protein
MDSAAKAAALMHREGAALLDWQRRKGSAMKIPESIKIPLIVFSLEAALLTGAALVLLVLIPHW